MENELYLTIHGVNWHIECGINSVREKLAKDFFIYRAKPTNQELHYLKLEASSSKAKKGDLHFSGGAVVRRNYLEKKATIYCRDLERLHEMAYLYILSILGKSMDQKGFHRVHAGAIAHEGDAYLFIGASGMGKSHLSFLLPCETLADDMLFINKAGECLPMLHRRGFNTSKSEEVVLNGSYSLERLDYGTKVLVPITKKPSKKIYPIKRFYFLQAGAKVGIRKASFWEKGRYLFLYVFIGLGTPQMIKFFWEPGLKDFGVKSRIAWSRGRLFLKLLFLEEGHILTTNRSNEVVDFMKCQLFGSKAEYTSRRVLAPRKLLRP